MTIPGLTKNRFRQAQPGSKYSKQNKALTFLPGLLNVARNLSNRTPCWVVGVLCDPVKPCGGRASFFT